MKSVKFLLVFGLTIFVAMSAWGMGQNAPSLAATSVNITVINKELAGILQKYNNNKTKMSAMLNQATVDARRATELSATATVQKNGAIPAVLTAAFNYSYLESQTKPLLDFNAKLDAPNSGVRKILVNLGLQPQKFDMFMAEAPQIVRQEALNLLQHQYGNAVAVTAKAVGIQKDKANHYVAETIDLNVTTNPAQLPPYVAPNKLMLTSAKIMLSINLNNGAALSGSVVLNPHYIGFQQNELGLKEYVEELEKNNPDALKAIASYAQYANYFLDAALHSNQ